MLPFLYLRLGWSPAEWPTNPVKTAFTLHHARRHYQATIIASSSLLLPVAALQSMGERLATHCSHRWYLLGA